MTTLLGAVLAIGLTVVGLACNGLLLAQLWEWFALPLGAPAIGTAHALGLALLAQAFIPTHREDKEEEWWEPLVRLVSRMLIALLVGWVIHCVMVTK